MPAAEALHRPSWGAMNENHAAGAPGPQRAAARRPALPAARGRMPAMAVTTQPRGFSAPHTLVALPSAAGCAQRYARAQARAWNLHDLADAAGVLAAELVTTAVAATGAPAPKRYADLHDRPLNFVILRLRARGAGLVIEVWGRDPAPPVHGEPAAAQTEPRPSALAPLRSRWGSYPCAGGKVVWCECAPGSRDAEAGLGPARAPRAEPATTAAR